MIPFAQADEYLKLELVEDYDVDTAFPQSARYRALQEAVYAIERLRPDEFAQLIELSFDSSTQAFLLPTTHERILEVFGVKVDGVIHGLDGNDLAGMIAKDRCWQTSSDAPTSFVWVPALPRAVFLHGDQYNRDDVEVVVSASYVGMGIDGNPPDSGNLPLAMSNFPDLIDHALRRLYHREDTGAGMQSQHLQTFRAGLVDKLGTDDFRNPLTAHQIRKAKQ